MRRPVRLGAVSYLNVRPLVHGLDAVPDVSLRFDVPAECARLLANGDIDLGMVPSITYADRPGDCIVPGVCIGSDGPVASVAIFSKKPLADITTIALDTSSRTSATLVRILCARKFNIAPTYIAHRPDLDAMLEVADAALLIGDAALFVDPSAPGVKKIDLGQEWTDLTGYPFVWAFWSGPSNAVDTTIVRRLQDAARTGMTFTDDIAAAYCASQPEWVPTAQRYLKENLVFDLSDRAIRGLTRYYSEAATLGLVGATPAIRFFEGYPVR